MMLMLIKKLRPLLTLLVIPATRLNRLPIKNYMNQKYHRFLPLLEIKLITKVEAVFNDTFLVIRLYLLISSIPKRFFTFVIACIQTCNFNYFIKICLAAYSKKYRITLTYISHIPMSAITYRIYCRFCCTD